MATKKADAEQPTATETTEQPKAEAKQPTSPQLTELETKRSEAKAAVNTAFTETMDFDSKAVTDARNELARIDGLIKAEIAAIHAAENKAKLDEQRNKRSAMVYNLLDVAGVQKPYNEATISQCELIVNELLAKYPKTSGGSGNSNASKTHGTKAEATRLHIINKANGMDDSESRKQIEASMFDGKLLTRSTVWHAVNDFNIANG